MPLRQFINLTDDDGEESFILLSQVLVMEFDDELLNVDEFDEVIDEDEQAQTKLRVRLNDSEPAGKGEEELFGDDEDLPF